jgi:hypothetical protein
MGVGIMASVKEVFPGVPDFICHFHFLRDLGKNSWNRSMRPFTSAYANTP